MRPRTFFSAAIVKLQHNWLLDSTASGSLLDAFLFRSMLVLYSNAFDVVAFQITADSFRLILVETGKTGTIIRRAVLDGRLGERIGVGQQLQRLDLHHAELPLGLILVRIGADLDDPATARTR